MRVNKKYLFLLFALFVALLAVLLTVYLHKHSLAVLDAKGPVARKERNLFAFGLALSAIVVIPVYVMLVGIIWKYRETNPRPATYRPDWDRSRLFEGLWWGIPCII